MYKDKKEVGEAMNLNREPIRKVTQQDIEEYNRDGVVCLRNVLSSDWIDSLEPLARDITIEKKDVGLLPNLPGRYMSRTVPEFRKLVFESPLAQVAGEVMQSEEIRFYFDEFFAKPPQSDAKTQWHCDRMGWPVSGKMVPSIWIPLTPIVKENCLEVLAGTQHDDVPYWLFSPNARKMTRPVDRVPHPDIEPRRGEPSLKFLSWDMDPGDILLIHPWVLHYSSGNPTNDWRIAISARVFGDDIRWAPRPDCLNLAGVSFDEMIEGQKPQGSHFPLLWSKSGARDSDSNFPTGFSASWDKQDLSDINEYELFTKMNEEQRRETIDEV